MNKSPIFFIKMKTIIFDVDDVICTNHFVPVVNLYLNSNYKENDFNNTKFELDLFKTKKIAKRKINQKEKLFPKKEFLFLFYHLKRMIRCPDEK